MKRHVGSSFDEFLADEGLLSETEATAVKRVIAYQLSQFMEENKLSKSAMAKRMQTSSRMPHVRRGRDRGSYGGSRRA